MPKTPGAFLVNSWCTPGALLVHSWCTPGALLFTPGELLVHSWCTPGALPVHSRCTPGALLVHSRCTPKVSRKGIALLPKGSLDPPHRNVWIAFSPSCKPERELHRFRKEASILCLDRLFANLQTRKGIAPLPKGSLDLPHRKVWIILRQLAKPKRELQLELCLLTRELCSLTRELCSRHESCVLRHEGCALRLQSCVLRHERCVHRHETLLTDTRAVKQVTWQSEARLSFPRPVPGTRETRQKHDLHLGNLHDVHNEDVGHIEKGAAPTRNSNRNTTRAERRPHGNRRR